jgi:hypothetical protein
MNDMPSADHLLQQQVPSSADMIYMSKDCYANLLDYPGILLAT